MKKSAPTFNLTTFGCQMNHSDSERITNALERAGFAPATQDQADVVIFNLCSVRQKPLDKIWGVINKFKIQKSKIKINDEKKNQRPIIILTGCILPADRKKFKERGVLVLNIKDLLEWPQKINSLKHKSIKTNYNNNEYLKIKPKYSSKYSAYVPIMTGCNNYCAYCVVPYTRGPERSRPVAEIITEIKKLIANGYREIILLGQNVNSYNAKIKMQKSKLRKINFSELLNTIDAIPGNYWLSFLTSHPKDMSNELINCFKSCHHLMPYLHLALQSGSDKILKAMNRKYTVKEYSGLIKKVRQINPLLTLSTDIIIGFPGETVNDFKQTAAIMKKIKFAMAYLAKYSPRPGTAAAKLKDNVSADAKEKRRNLLNNILKKTALAHNQKLIGQTLNVLVDKIDANVAYGHTNSFKHVKIKLSEQNKKLAGEFIKVKITHAGAWSLAGDEIKNKTALK